MEPYFEGDGIVLYHGDARNIEAWLEADVLVTDPPYGVSYQSNMAIAGPSKAIAGDDDTEARADILELWGDRPALVFGSWKIERPANVRHLLIWDKGDSPGMGDLSLPWGPGHEEIYVMGKGWTGQRRTNVYRVNTYSPSSHDRPDHPTPKPLNLLEQLVEYCPPGVIADPFAGSGSTLIAARNRGRLAVGCEIDEAYCELIARRLAQPLLI